MVFVKTAEVEGMFTPRGGLSTTVTARYDS